MRSSDSKLHFSLPLIEALNPTSPDWMLDEKNWALDEESKKAFEDARDGQGFSGIVFAERGVKTQQCVARITLCVAYNASDGLARENKWGVPYQKFQFVESEGSRTAMGVGVIHKKNIAQEALKKALQDEKFNLTKRLNVTLRQKFPNYAILTFPEQKKSRESIINHYLDKMVASKSVSDLVDELQGYTIGFGVVKGAESHDSKDYQIFLVQKKIMIEKLNQFYTECKTESMLEFPSNKKCLVFVKDEKNTLPDAYHLFYIQNQKLVRSIEKFRTDTPPVVYFAANIKKENLIDLCFEALQIKDFMKIFNKSASQNNASVSYDFDYENHMMFADSTRYKDDLPESNSLYDLKRSCPPDLMIPMLKTMYRAFGKDVAQQDEVNFINNWSSWTNPPYHDYKLIVTGFNSLTVKDKHQVIEANLVHIINLFLENFDFMLGVLEKTLASPDELHTHPHMMTYLTGLHERLEQSVMLYIAVQDKDVKHFTFPIDKNINKYNELFAQYVSSFQKKIDVNLNEIEKMNGKSSFQKREELKDQINGYKKYIERAKEKFNYKMDFEGWFAAIKSIENPLQIKDKYLQRARESALKICKTTVKSDVIQAFSATGKSLFNSLRFAHADKKATRVELKLLLQIEDPETKVSALQNVIQQGWYDMAECLVYHGAILTEPALNALIEQVMKGKNVDKIDLALANILSMTKTIDPNFVKKIKECPLPVSQKKLPSTYQYDLGLYKSNKNSGNKRKYNRMSPNHLSQL